MPEKHDTSRGGHASSADPPSAVPSEAATTNRQAPPAATQSPTGSPVRHSTVTAEDLRPAKTKATLFALAIVTLLGLLVYFVPDERVLKSKPTNTPRGTVNLQLAADESIALAILLKWKKKPGALPAAQASIENDTHWYIPLYFFVFLICGIMVLFGLNWGQEHWQPAFLWSALFGFLCLIAAACVDLCVENPPQLSLIQQAIQLDDNPSPERQSDLLQRTKLLLPRFRAAAQIKFSLLAIVWGLVVAGTLGATRRMVVDRRRAVVCGARDAAEASLITGTFETLIARERGIVEVGEQNDTGLWQSEPWTKTLQADMVGLAFSGGGIRSATFNLGLLQGLAGLNILPLVHYLSTVSGGGYIGGWWSAWRRRLQEHVDRPLFPGTGGPSQSPGATPAEPPTDNARSEAEEVRHLREFSNFLAPRWGFFEIEMWNALIAVLFGLVPTLLLALGCLLTFQLLWVASTAHLATRCPYLLMVEAVVPLAIVLVCAELAWRQRHLSPGEPDGGRRAYAFFAVLGWATVGWLAWELPQTISKPGLHFWNQVYRWGGITAPAETDWIGWMKCLGTTSTKDVTHFCPRLFDLPAIWLIGGAMLSVVRIVVASTSSTRHARDWMPPVDRALTRLLALAVVWGIAGALWEAGVYLEHIGQTEIASGGAVGGAGAFALLRNWLTRVPRMSGSGGRITKLLKPFVPQILAYGTVALAYVVAASAAVQLGTSPLRWQFVWFALVTLGACGLQLVPSEFGLHAFYRNRISRAFLGASNPDAYDPHQKAFVAGDNRQTDLRRQDDLWLHDLAHAGKPLHLVCCTANHLSGDQLAMLGRGGRSAVLSCHGISIGNHWAERPQLSLGSALTASAAAFNSEMGSVSAKLGPAVSFLMSALNLRLGLWVAHPRLPVDEPKWFPGRHFFKELFGLSDCADASNPVGVHLSDGGHFENLALYELIRRHCRYIIVSDCGADPLVQFEDFGNAVRRIREDFGVDIEIDLEPLRPDSSGRSKQHAVVGTIRFDPNGGDRDVGIIVYVKPALTGDEPCDIANYRTLNPAFPHETTGDQFYDEAQWESYRRLGSHAAFETFSFLDGRTDPRIYEVFSGVRDRWYPTPPELDQKLMEVNDKFIQFEHRLAHDAPARFMRQLFPELPPPQLPPQTAQSGGRPTDDAALELHLLLEMIQIMEDTVLSVDFRRNFNHPLLLGWVNTFHRWAHADVFRLWWPILSPLYSPSLRRFAEERFDLAETSGRGVASFDIDLRPDWGNPLQFDIACDQVLQRSGRPFKMGPVGGASKYALFRLAVKSGQISRNAVVGASRFETKFENQIRVAEWRDADFLIVPGLWGAGLGGRFLEQFLTVLGNADFLWWHWNDPSPVKLARVVIDLNRTDGTGFLRRDLGHRRERNDLVVFYKSHGFTALPPALPAGSQKAKEQIVMEKSLTQS